MLSVGRLKCSNLNQFDFFSLNQMHWIAVWYKLDSIRCTGKHNNYVNNSKTHEWYTLSIRDFFREHTVTSTLLVSKHSLCNIHLHFRRDPAFTVSVTAVKPSRCWPLGTATIRVIHGNPFTGWCASYAWIHATDIPIQHLCQWLVCPGFMHWLCTSVRTKIMCSGMLPRWKLVSPSSLLYRPDGHSDSPTEDRYFLTFQYRKCSLWAR